MSAGVYLRLKGATLGEDSVTKSELARYLATIEVTFRPLPHAIIGSHSMPGKLVYPDIAAELVFKQKLPPEEYTEGKHYIDAAGNVYQYDVKFDGTKRWWGIAAPSPLNFTTPKRPLREVK